MQKIFPLRITRKHIRMIAWPLFILLFTTVGIPLLFFFYWFNAEKVKQIVISQFNNQNYAVVINGSVEPRSWHGLSLFIADLTVEDKNHRKILHINTANCQLSWPDLIIGHYKVKRIAFNGVTFYQANINKVNYANLLDYGTIAKSEFSNLTNFSITNLNLVESEDKYIIRDANLRVSGLTSEPKMHMNFRIARSNADVDIRGLFGGIENNKVLISSLVTRITSPKVNMEFQSQGHYAYTNQELWVENTKGLINNSLYNGTVDINTILLSGYGLTIDNLNATILNSLNNFNQVYHIDAHRIETDNFNDFTANSINVKYDATNAKTKLNIMLELEGSTLDKLLNLTNNSCNIGAKITTSNSDNTTNTINAGLHGSCSYFGAKETTQLNLSGKIDNNPAQIKISYEHAQAKPTIHLVGVLGGLDLSKLVTDANNGDILPLYSDKSILPLSWLNWFNLDADLSFTQVDLSRINLSNVKTSFQVKDDKLKLSNFQANAYGGGIAGTAQISKVGESYNFLIQQQISDVSLQKLFTNLFNVSAIQGKANLLINTTANGVMTYEDLHRKLNGQISLRVIDGGFNGVDFSLFLSPENLAAFQNRKGMTTNFTQLKADFDFINGVSDKSDINFSSPTIAASGDGQINFAETKIDYKINVSSILPLNSQRIKSVSIPVEINGDLFNPKIYIQNMTLNTEVHSQERLRHEGKGGRPSKKAKK